MRQSTRWGILASAVAAVGAIAVISTMVAHHPADQRSAPAVRADMSSPAAPALNDDAIRRHLEDSKIAVTGLSVRSAGDIVLLRGTGDAASSAAAVELVKSLGVRRVANLITPPAASDDDAIRRDAERELTANRAFDGCKLRVSCDRGVLRVSGTVHNELQKDAARMALRNVSGVRGVELDLAVATASM